METLVQSPSIKSFPYAWLGLPNLSPSVIEASTDEHGETSFIEMDPRLPPSKRFIHLSFDLVFDFPLSSQSSLHINAHADDELTSTNGYLIPPLFPDNKKTIEMLKSEDHYNNISSTEKPVVNLMARIHCVILRRLQRMSKRFFMKYFAFLLRRPVFHGRRGCQFGKNSASTFTSPRSSSADCDSETSIYEAVLHCKRNHGS